jgi:hypothetical protein
MIGKGLAPWLPVFRLGSRLLRSFGTRFVGLDVLQSKRELVGIDALGSRAELRPLKLFLMISWSLSISSSRRSTTEAMSRTRRCSRTVSEGR